MDLYTYYRSTASYRVRIALALKGLDFQAVPVNLLVPVGGANRQPAYLAINPQGRVPALRTDEGELLIQSPAIIEYLEERYPQVPLLPEDLLARAQVRGVAAVIGCDVHPLHNVSVLNLLRQAGQDEPQVNQWIAHWISQGLSAVEQLIGELQRIANESTQIMQSSVEQTQSTVTGVRNTGDALAVITRQVSEIQQMSLRIASAAEEQTGVVEEITRSVLHVRETADQSALASSEIATSSVELARLGHDLQSLVVHFRT